MNDFWLNLDRRWRQVRGLAKGVIDRDHPILAQIIPMRRCNLACAYCNEYDAVSPPVPLEQMLRRIDRLGELRTSIVTISGGEPLMHPELDAVIRRIRERGMIAGLITNGFYLGPERIRRLNEAGLEYLQISIDNVEPDSVSKKSLKTLDKKLVHLAEHARFQVNINSVVGGLKNPEDALTIARRAAGLGFSVTVGILHDEKGQLAPLSPREVAIYDEIVRLGGTSFYSRILDFQKNLIAGKPNDWRCLAGARYLYVCEDGLVHYCSQQRGYPGVPLEDYGVADIRREFRTEKSCAPYCTIGCVHRASALDRYRPSEWLNRRRGVASARLQVIA